MQLDIWNIGEHALQERHNWSKLLKVEKPTLNQIRPYIEKVLREADWSETGKWMHGSDGHILGQELTAALVIDGHEVWVTALRRLTGEIIVNNAGVNW